MAVDNYYDILSIDTSADEETIRAAIRKTRSRYRQVAGSPNKEQARNAEVMIEKLAKAESALLEPQARRAYDAQLAAQPAYSAEPIPVGAGASDWIATAKSYLANGQPRNASQAAKEATRADPRSPDAWTVRAYAALELEDISDAEFSASEAQKCDPGNPLMFGLLGDIYDREERYADAQAAFQRAADLDPTDPYWVGRVAWALSDQGRAHEAVTTSYKVSVEFPDSEYAKSTYGMMLLKEAEGSLTLFGDGIYFTNKKQIEFVEERLEVVRQLGSTNENVNNFYSETSRFVAQAKSRRFTASGCFPWILGIFVFFGSLSVLTGLSMALGSGSVGGIITGLFATGIVFVPTAALAWWMYSLLFPPQWKVNQRAIGSSGRGGLR